MEPIAIHHDSVELSLLIKVTKSFKLMVFMRITFIFNYFVTW